MPKMTVRVILKSGVEFSIKCDKFTLTRNGFQQVTGYNIECPHCGAHLDSGEKCDCRAAEADGNAEKELKERTKDNDN